MRKVSFIFRLLPFFITLLSCQNGKHGDCIEDVLIAAGDNRTELEQVLEHYSDKGDSLKLEAAKFLIRNMLGHYSYADTLSASHYYDAVDKFLTMNPDCSPVVARAAIDSLGCLLLNQAIEPDINIVNADFLINNIDNAFDSWKHSPWAQHINFEDFCEFLLPYKLVECQPMDNWRKNLTVFAPDVLDDLHYCDQYRNLTLKAAEEVNRSLFIEYNISGGDSSTCHWSGYF